MTPLHPCQQINTLISACNACSLNTPPYEPGLPTHGIGVLNPRIMIVGEAPGQTESQTGRPFVGASGKVLQALLQEAGASLDEIYVTNVVKHRPPSNRDPTPSEIDSCKHFLLEEISLVQPHLILCAGRISSYVLAQAASFSLPPKNLRGLSFTYQSIPVRLTWHPAYVMRNPLKKPELLADILSALDETR